MAKVTREKPKFQTLTIVLESDEEISWLADTIYDATCVKKATRKTNFLFNLWHDIEKEDN
jgi:hypothetical protein